MLPGTALAGSTVVGAGLFGPSLTTGVLVPLDAQAAVEALMNSGLATLIQFAMLLLAVVLTGGAIILAGLAGVANMSQDASRQHEASRYIRAAGIALVAAMIVGAGPEILTALGMETAEHFNAINVFSG